MCPPVRLPSSCRNSGVLKIVGCANMARANICLTFDSTRDPLRLMQIVIDHCPLSWHLVAPGRRECGGRKSSEKKAIHMYVEYITKWFPDKILSNSGRTPQILLDEWKMLYGMEQTWHWLDWQACRMVRTLFCCCLKLCVCLAYHYAYYLRVTLRGQLNSFIFLYLYPIP